MKKPEIVEVSDVVPATPARIYKAWLSGKEHAAFTAGGEATASTKVGGAFTAWDGYISGENLKLERNKRIVQSWRSTDFPRAAKDSRLEVLLEKADGGTRVTFVHSGFPAGQAKGYRQGWRDFYFKPMKAYFAKKR